MRAWRAYIGALAIGEVPSHAKVPHAGLSDGLMIPASDNDIRNRIETTHPLLQKNTGCGAKDALTTGAFGSQIVHVIGRDG